MADLGAISQGYINIVSRPIAFWRDYGTTTQLMLRDISDSIAVTVTLDSVAQEGALARLYYRPNGKLIHQGLSNASGEVSFNSLDVSDTANYFAVITLPTGDHNAIIYDKL